MAQLSSGAAWSTTSPSSNASPTPFSPTAPHPTSPTSTTKFTPATSSQKTDNFFVKVMADSTSENKKIFKNTFFMYFRMIIAMVVSLYTSRIVLDELGITDYGVYNIIGGIVVIFSFVNNAMASSTSRFISYAIGQGNNTEINNIFRNTLTMHLGLSLFVILLSETIGLWYLYNVMVLPDLGTTIQVVYQCSILNVVILIISVPFSSIIISYEKMNVYAYLAIIDVFAKLGIAFLLSYCGSIKLEIYAIAQIIVSFLILLFYYIYCLKIKIVSSIRPKLDKVQIRSLFNFSSWTLYSSGGTIASTQGMNLLLNHFFGVVVNAAYGISVQIQRAVYSLSLNFQIAINPQIIKSKSNEDYIRHHMLVERSAKFSSFLIILLVFPIYFNLTEILDLWLKDYPLETIGFTKWILLTAIITTFANPFGVSVEASGNIGRMTFIYTTITFLTIPITYLLINKYNLPNIAFVILFINSIITLFIKLYYSHKINKISIQTIIRKALIPVFIVTFLSYISCLFLSQVISLHFIIEIFIELITIGIIVFIIGLNTNERNFIYSIVKIKLKNENTH